MHDKNGRPIKTGDRVSVEFVITETSATEEFCNVKCETVEPMYPSARHDTSWFNAKQVIKAEESSCQE